MKLLDLYSPAGPEPRCSLLTAGGEGCAAIFGERSGRSLERCQRSVIETSLVASV